MTCVGPEAWIGDYKFGFCKKLWWISSICGSMIKNYLPGRRPKYFMCVPMLLTQENVDRVHEAGVKPQIQEVYPYTIESLQEAISKVATHRVKGRIIVDMDKK